MYLFLSFSPQWTVKRLQTRHAIKVRGFGCKLVNSVDKVTNFVQHGKLATKIILTWAPGRHILRYKVINYSTETAELHPWTYGLKMEATIFHSKKMAALHFTTIPYELARHSLLGTCFSPCFFPAYFMSIIRIADNHYNYFLPPFPSLIRCFSHCIKMDLARLGDNWGAWPFTKVSTHPDQWE